MPQNLDTKGHHLLSYSALANCDPKSLSSALNVSELSIKSKPGSSRFAAADCICAGSTSGQLLSCYTFRVQLKSPGATLAIWMSSASIRYSRFYSYGNLPTPDGNGTTMSCLQVLPVSLLPKLKEQTFPASTCLLITISL